MILIFLISILNSCEVDLSDTVRPSPSKIWVKAIVGVDDNVKIYIGNTSGLNSGDKAQYRNDAIVKLKVNSGLQKNLKYIIDPKSPYKGYYFTYRLDNSSEGDTLSFIAWIPDSEFDTARGETIVPRIPDIETPKVKTTPVDGDFLIDMDLSIKDTIDTESYFEIKLKGLKYSDVDGESPSTTEIITLLNDLKLSYGLTWNEKLRSILFDYRDLEGDSLHVSFNLRNNYSRIELGFELKKVTKEYFDYFKALDSGSIVNSNIENGSGIFAGYSKYYKNIRIK